jgi:aminoglycoside phosphotransferase (APT) family kinase protein
VNELREKAEEIAREELENVKEVEEIHGGLMSHTFSVSAAGKDYILQMTSESEPHELENCIRSFEFLSGTVPVPEPVTGEVREHGGVHYTIVEKVKGETLETGQEIDEAAGEILAKIHESRSFDRPGWIAWKNSEPFVQGFPDDSLRGRIREVAEGWKEFFKEQEIEWLTDACDTVLENLHVVPDDFTPVLVHHDFNPGNIMVHEGDITAVLDFDYAHASHDVRDLAKAANKFHIRGGNREDLYRGYRNVRAPDKFDETIDFYLLETLLDEIGGMMDLDHIDREEAEEYRDEIRRLSKNLR